MTCEIPSDFSLDQISELANQPYQHITIYKATMQTFFAYEKNKNNYGRLILGQQDKGE